MKRFAFVILLASVFSTSIAQKQNIERVKNKFYCNGAKVSLSDLANTMVDNDEAYVLMLKASTNKTYGFLYRFVGIAALGLNGYNAIKGKEHDWLFTGIGVGLIGVSIPFSIMFKKQSRQAVLLYNTGLNKPTVLQISINKNSLGLGFAF